MKVNMIKTPGGGFYPHHDRDAEILTKLKTGDVYPVEIKKSRNGKFHGKVFSFLNFCFDHWRNGNEFQDEIMQFDVFRKHLTVLAGFYHELFNINGELRIEAKSISYGSMSQQEYEHFYNAIINAAMKHVFHTADELTYNKLIGFF